MPNDLPPTSAPSTKAARFRDDIHADVKLRARAYLPPHLAEQLADHVLADVLARIYQHSAPSRPKARARILSNVLTPNTTEIVDA